MKVKDFKDLKKNKTPKQIIALHTHNIIRLTGKQVDEMIKLKNKTN